MASKKLATIVSHDQACPWCGGTELLITLRRKSMFQQCVKPKEVCGYRASFPKCFLSYEQKQATYGLLGRKQKNPSILRPRKKVKRFLPIT